jgi:hypothetical protein
MLALYDQAVAPRNNLTPDQVAQRVQNFMKEFENLQPEPVILNPTVGGSISPNSTGSTTPTNSTTPPPPT